MSETRQRALELLGASGFAGSTADAALSALESGGLRLADTARDEFVCRWVNAAERAVPPTADTIIRTVTRTHGDSCSGIHVRVKIDSPS